MTKFNLVRMMSKDREDAIRFVVLWLLFVLAMLWVSTAYGQTATTGADTLEVRFRAGLSELDLSYGDNARQVSDFISCIRRQSGNSQNKLYVNVFTGASPEGPAELNRRLGEQRGISLRRVLADRLYIEGLADVASRIIVVNNGARWSDFYNMISRCNEPWRDDVLKILGRDTGNVSEWDSDPRESSLKRLDGGKVWQQISERYLPRLRSAGFAVISSKPAVPAVTVHDTLVIRDTVYYVPDQLPRPVRYYWQGNGWAFKTNVLFWTVGTPNIQVEHTLGRRWSIEAELDWAWWTISHNAYANEMFYGSAELRYWLGNRVKHHTLDGWHLGLAVGGGYYDLEWKSEGYQGEALNVYANIGYQHRFGRNRQWLFDASLGLGWFHSPYRHYKGSSTFPVGHEEHYDDHLMWQDSKMLNWFGATHVNITLGYVLGSDRQTKIDYSEPSPELYRQERAAKKKEKAEKTALERKQKAEKNAAENAAKDAKKAKKAEEKRVFKENAERARIDLEAKKKAEKEERKRMKAERKALKMNKKNNE